jgi:hypothetical protein
VRPNPIPANAVDVVVSTDRSFVGAGRCEGSLSTRGPWSAQKTCFRFALTKKTFSMADQVTEWLEAYLTHVFSAAICRRQPHHTDSSHTACQRLQECTALSSVGNFGMQHLTLGMVAFSRVILADLLVLLWRDIKMHAFLFVMLQAYHKDD